MTDQSGRMRAELTFKGNTGRARYGWLRLTPAYSVQLVQQLVAENGVGPILDPFAGTGTTVLAANEQGIAAWGLDINPFLVWLGETKAQTYAEQDVCRARHRLRYASQRIDQPPKVGGYWQPALHHIEKWWSADVLSALGRLHGDLGLGEEIASAPQRLLAIVFCSVMISCANVSFGHQSMSFKERQASLFEDKEWLRDSFDTAADRVLSEASAWNAPVEHEFVLGDARDVDQVLAPQRFPRVITSPPYPNRMSYIRELRPYMYWLGYLAEPQDAGNLDWKAIGGTWGSATSKVADWEPEEEAALGRAIDRASFDAISTRSGTLANYVLKYFCDIEHHIGALRRVLSPGARVDYIVGNSKYYDTLVHTQDIYARLFEDNGFENVTVAAIRKRSSKKELFEYQVTAFAP